MTAPILIIGGGVAGLACAIDLARGGHRVVVLERGAAVGGKMRQVVVGDAAFDAGPTVLTMRHVFESLFADAGADFVTRVPTRPLETLARHAWPDGSQLDLFADHARSAAAIAAFAGPEAAAGFERFHAYAAAIYAEVEGPFIHGPRPTMGSIVAARGMKVFSALKTIDSWRTMWDALGKFFPDPRLQQLFGRYATYCGSSPFEAPATLNLIAHVEAIGVSVVRGGMYRLAQALRELAEELGVEIRCGAHVQGIDVDRGRVTGVTLADGTAPATRALVATCGLGPLVRGHFGDLGRRVGRTPPDRSLSAITWCMTATVRGFDLAFHNVFFSTDYPAEFTDLHTRPPQEPTVYICAQDRDGFDDPPGGAERIFMLVNAPPLGDTPGWDARITAARNAAFAVLERAGVKLEVHGEVCTGPAEFEALFPGTGGALYGPPTHGWRASLKRPGSRTGLKGLYLAGGGAHPGAGVPMAALSGRLAATAISEDLA